MTRPTGPAGAPATLTVRSREDLVAFVPLALGFVPSDSAVLVTFDAHGSSFHARIDLRAEDSLDEVVETLLAACVRHRVVSVFLICWADAALTEDVAWRFSDRFTDEGVEVRDVLRVEEDRWFAVLPGHPLHEYDGVPIDLDAHPFSAHAVLAGDVRYRTRADLRASIDALPEARPLPPGQPYPPRLLGGLVRDAIAQSRALSDEELAALVTSVRHGARRDQVWSHLERTGAARALVWWREVVRRVPDEQAADVCAVLAFVAWLAGNGALAWCAIDRARRSRSDHSLAELVADLLDNACAPSEWEGLRAVVRAGAGPAA